MYEKRRQTEGKNKGTAVLKKYLVQKVGVVFLMIKIYESLELPRFLVKLKTEECAVVCNVLSPSNWQE